MKITGLFFTIVLIALTCSCKHVVQYDCTGITPTYTTNIKPILDNCCATRGCHSGNRDGMDLSTYAGASAASKNKNFMGTIQHLPFYQKMPQDAARLPDSQIHLLSCWVENGSPE
ncbi:MAG: hypothetical protein NTW16_14335 [Bacteroidetes bacterium]|nr:hypothetical protein [Bacteroidota bacterium]